MELLKTILLSLNNSNYLKTQCTLRKNQKLICKYVFLDNGLKVRRQLLNHWQHMATKCVNHCESINQNNEIQMVDNNRVSFLQNTEFQKRLHFIQKQNLVNSTNSIAFKTIYNRVSNFVGEKDFFYSSDINTLLVSDFFVGAVSQLSKYYNLQRERKIWWMRFSADTSRYLVEPYEIPSNADEAERKKCKSITIRAKFPFGSVDMESITLVPLYEFCFSNSSGDKKLSKISLIRSVINLDLTTCDASKFRTQYKKNELLIHRQLAPYQVVLVSLHQGNATVDELSVHLKHVVCRSELRLFDNIVHINHQSELENYLASFNCLGIPYTLVVDDESCKSGLLKLRSRDTNLFENIHISDIPNYLNKIFKQ